MPCQGKAQPLPMRDSKAATFIERSTHTSPYSRLPVSPAFLSFPRRRESITAEDAERSLRLTLLSSSYPSWLWIPACAGMTAVWGRRFILIAIPLRPHTALILRRHEVPSRRRVQCPLEASFETQLRCSSG